MKSILGRAAAAFAGAAVAAALGMGTAHATIVHGSPGGPGRGCVMYNGTVLKDGQSYTTSIGTVITCIDGFVCRHTPSKGTGADSCRIEAGSKSIG
jgi:hypothetical protein